MKAHHTTHAASKGDLPRGSLKEFKAALNKLAVRLGCEHQPIQKFTRRPSGGWQRPA
jgi:hypothetical protein